MRRDRVLKFPTLETFVITLQTGESWRGLLEDSDDGHLVLVSAELLSDTGSTKVDGRIYLPRANVAYMQRP